MIPISEHNTFYLTEDRSCQPREFFKFLANLAALQLAANPRARILDVGCANGEFLYYLRSRYPAVRVAGIDVASEFLVRARGLVPDGEFSIGDIYSGETLPRQCFDLVFMNGVNYLLPEYEPWLRNLISVCRGTVYVFGIFNPEDLDVRAAVTRSGDTGSSTPWNLISQKSISLFLDGIGKGMTHRFHNWELPVDIPRVNPDPMRCWTVTTDDGRRLQINGLQIIHALAVLEIEVGEAFSVERRRVKSLPSGSRCEV